MRNEVSMKNTMKLITDYFSVQTNETLDPPPLLLRKNTRTKSVYKVITSTSVK